MPQVSGAEGSFFATPGSREIEELDRRWAAGQFLARVDGVLLTRDGDSPTTLFVPDGQDPRLVSGLLLTAIEPPAAAYLSTEVVWREQ
jgi:hypothetical protein